MCGPTVTEPTEPVATTPFSVGLFVSVTSPTWPLADTPVSVIARSSTVTVPTEPVADTPVKSALY